MKQLKLSLASATHVSLASWLEVAQSRQFDLDQPMTLQRRGDVYVIEQQEESD